MEAPDPALRALLRAKGLRATPARLRVYTALRDHGLPVTHAQVCELVAEHGFDRATVYRNLTDLVEAGLARRLDVGDHVWRFEGREGAEPDAEGHPHFVCVECGNVQCLPEEALAFAPVPGLPRALTEGQGEVHVRGKCDDCG
ncbi:MAG: transcriptional repressor [Myxococcota bacterium]